MRTARDRRVVRCGGYMGGWEILLSKGRVGQRSVRYGDYKGGLEILLSKGRVGQADREMR